MYPDGDDKSKIIHSIEDETRNKERRLQVLTRVTFCIVPGFLFFLALYMFYSILSQLYVDILCEVLEESDCSGDRVSGEASIVGVYCSLASSIPGFLLTGTYRSISICCRCFSDSFLRPVTHRLLADIRGRKYAMVPPLFGFCLYIGAVLFVSVFRPKYFVYIVVPAAFLSGCCGT